MERLNVKIEELPIDKVQYNRGQIDGVPNNPRKISKEKFDALKKSIQESPEMNVLTEIKVFPYKGSYVAISGNHRLKAYKALGWKTVLCKVLPEDTPVAKLREYVIKENMLYAETDNALLKAWDVKELAAWDVPMKLGGAEPKEQAEVEFTQVLDEEHNYIVLYFDNKVDWLQAETMFDIKPVRGLSTNKSSINSCGKRMGIGRVLRGADALNKILQGTGIGEKFNGKAEDDENIS